MPLSPGTRLGAYEILAAIGAGGMGEVYRARDTKLGRDVAIKTLPELFVNSPERVARLEREAQMLAALNHPRIAAIYGFEESPSGRFLVLELVDGESLAARIERDASTGSGSSRAASRKDAPQGLPIEEALAIAAQVVDALEVAHDKGIIHRDLKPANIMLTGDGQVKVLDFGLARATEADPSASVSNSPTLSLAATQAGVILGTAAYMSPEQAKGRVADKRSDVWAFGCVLFEMLTGRKAFDGEDVSDTLAAILRGEPDWSAIPDGVPANVRTIVRRSLERDRKARIPDFAVVRYLLSGVLTAAPAQTPAPQPGRIARWRLIAGALLFTVAGAALGAAAWRAVSRWSAAPPQPMRLAIAPGATTILSSATDRTIAISDDGTRIAYVSVGAGTTLQLVVRRLDRLEATPLAGTNGARWPFFSPDGRWIGFYTTGELKKISVEGGPAVTLCRINGAPRGATWLDASTIVYATDDLTSGLMSVASSGGAPKMLTKPDAVASQLDHVLPAALPGGRAILYTAVARGQADAARIEVLDLASGQQRTVISAGNHAAYVDTGHLVYAIAGTLRAVRFDPERLEAIGDPSPMESGVQMAPTGAANFAISRQGHLVFVPGAEGTASAARTLVWVDRKGREEAIPAPPRAYAYVRISPDGTQLAFAARDQEHDIWVWNLARRTPTRITFGPAIESVPLWMPDNRRVLFQSSSEGPPNIFAHAADGTGTTERLTTSPNLQAPTSITADGSTLILTEVVAQTGPDLGVVRLDGKSKPQPLIQTAFADAGGELSPDGRWLAYQSNESGQANVYVRPFPDVNGGRWHISPSGGLRPVWAQNGRELYYQEAGGAVMAVPVETAATFRTGNPTKLFDARYFTAVPGRPFDVAADGRFVMIKEPAADQSSSQHAGLILVLNWGEELKAKVPAK